MMSLTKSNFDISTFWRSPVNEIVDTVDKLEKTERRGKIACEFESPKEKNRKEADEEAGPLNPFCRAAEFWQGPDELDWLIPDLIPHNSLSLVAGRPKTGKTLLALNLAVALTTGGNFLCRPCHFRQVGVIQLEDPESLVRSRLKAMVEEPPEGLFLSVGTPWTQDLRDRLRAFINLHNLELLIIDPLILWKPGTRENSADEMAPLMYELRQVVQLTGCSILVVHHSRKGDGDHGDSIRGSSAILGSVDVALELIKEEDGRAHLRVISRFGAVEDEALELETETMTWRSLGPARQVEGERRRIKVLEALEELGEASVQELLEVLDIPRPTLYRDIKNLEREGRVSSREAREGHGRPSRKYFVSPDQGDVRKNHTPSELAKHHDQGIFSQSLTPIGGPMVRKNQNPSEEPIVVGCLEALEGQEWVEEPL